MMSKDDKYEMLIISVKYKILGMIRHEFSAFPDHELDKLSRDIQTAFLEFEKQFIRQEHTEQRHRINNEILGNILANN